ncbi:MAG: GAF domain-containing protein, partial [Alphaproteobacteria bacterium]
MPASGNLSRLRLPRSADAPTLNSESAISLLALIEAQGNIIDNMADGAGLRETLTEIALLIERIAPPALCSILLLQRDGQHLRPAAAPSLPEQYRDAMNGIEIGPCAGSCGTAAYRKEPVIVTDIATDPLWAAPREFTLSFGLRACWSMPIIRSDGLVLGTIAMYYREPRAPTAGDWGWLEPASKLVRLALAQNRREEELRESEARWTLAAEAAGLGTYDVDVYTEHDIWSDQFKALLGLDAATEPSLDLLISLVHPDDRARFLKSFGPKADYRVYRNEEFRIRRANDGEERIVVLKGRVLTNA